MRSSGWRRSVAIKPDDAPEIRCGSTHQAEEDEPPLLSRGGAGSCDASREGAPTNEEGGEPRVQAKVRLHAPELDYCKWGCGRAVHMRCSLEWRAHRNECVFCGSFWS